MGVFNTQSGVFIMFVFFVLPQRPFGVFNTQAKDLELETVHQQHGVLKDQVEDLKGKLTSGQDEIAAARRQYVDT